MSNSDKTTCTGYSGSVEHLLAQIREVCKDIDDWRPDYIEMRPDYYEYIKYEYLPDFLKCEEDRDYSYSVEASRGGAYKLVVTDWSTDYRQDTVIKIPSFILEENWCNDVESQRISRRINEIDKEINRIEVIMASGTGQIMELNKEKEELEIKLRELK